MVSRRPKLSAAISRRPGKALRKANNLCNGCSARRSISNAGKPLDGLSMLNAMRAKAWVLAKKSSALNSKLSGGNKGRSASCANVL